MIISMRISLNSGTYNLMSTGHNRFRQMANSRTSYTIQSFADDRNLCYLHSVNGRSSPLEIDVDKSNMKISGTSDLHSFSEWGRMNRIDYNAQKSQCCLQKPRHSNNVASSVAMFAVNIRQSEAVDVVGMKIQFENIHNLWFFKTVLPLYATYIRLRIQHTCMGQCLKINVKVLDHVQQTVKVAINDSHNAQ